MKTRTIAIFTASVFVVVILQAFAAFGTSSKALESIKMCLPKADTGAPYQYSLASYTDIKPSRWFLVRAVDSNPLAAPSYSVVEVRDRTCKNYHKYPVIDLTRSRSLPKSVISKFMSVIKQDTDIAYKMSEQVIRKRYPGKSQQDLQRMGVFGMDGL